MLQMLLRIAGAGLADSVHTHDECVVVELSHQIDPWWRTHHLNGHICRCISFRSDYAAGSGADYRRAL